MQCTATGIHTHLENYQTTAVELFCIHFTVSLHFNNYMTTFSNVKIKLFLADKL